LFASSEGNRKFLFSITFAVVERPETAKEKVKEENGQTDQGLLLASETSRISLTLFSIFLIESSRAFRVNVGSIFSRGFFCPFFFR
jgi:hypothetical protein